MVKETIDGLEESALASLKVTDLLRKLIASGHAVHVVYSTGDWLDVDSVDDVLSGSTFS